MKSTGFFMVCLLTVGLHSLAKAADRPADTYFSLAVTENSHNHYGENLLFLNFQETPNPAVIDARVVISPRVPDNAIQVDGNLKEWNPKLFTRVSGRVMNNYPLSEFYDTRPGEILVASAYDSQYVYFAVEFEDTNRDASINRKRWIYTKGAWQTMPHLLPNPALPMPVNATDELEGKENEDRVLFMFPIVDQQRNFRDGGLGCAGYCHPNLTESKDPKSAPIGDEVAEMHTAMPGDVADVWHWKSSRSNPGHVADDAHIVFAEGSVEGFKYDPGESADMDNNEKSLKLSETGKPAYVNREDYQAGRYATPGFSTVAMTVDSMMRITDQMTFAEGTSLPYSILRKAVGSRADVTAYGSFDPATSRWSIEFMRKRDTGDPLDHAFVPGPDASFPTTPPVKPGNAQLGQTLFKERACAHCHGDNGEGKFADGHWVFPRNQRVSGALIAKTVALHRPERLRALAFLGRDDQNPPPQVMPYVPLSRQEAEDIAAWLQARFIPKGQ
ncbi:MAG: c-type cytochrome [Magnetococcales bacterium]|nr:c-type cytochrome [Magnetococcales bacterium]